MGVKLDLLHLRKKETSLKVFDMWVLRRIFGPKGEELT
jgi:hypothetical protein